MFRFNSRKPARKTNDKGLTGMLVHNLEQAEKLLDIDFGRGHDYFVRAEEIYGNLCRDTAQSFPGLEFRLDQLYIAYQIEIDIQNLPKPHHNLYK